MYVLVNYKYKRCHLYASMASIIFSYSSHRTLDVSTLARPGETKPESSPFWPGGLVGYGNNT